MGRASKEQAAQNRIKVVAAASSLFRRKGIGGVGIDELMSEAGLTHGGFYGQFGSKDALAGEACAHAFEAAEQAWGSIMHADAAGQDAAGRAHRLARTYLASRSGDHCPMATLAGDAARAPAESPLRRAFTAGLRRLADLVAGKEEPRDESLALLAAIVGAAVLRRASNDEELAESIETAVLRLAARTGDRRDIAIGRDPSGLLVRAGDDQADHHVLVDNTLPADPGSPVGKAEQTPRRA